MTSDALAAMCSATKRERSPRTPLSQADRTAPGPAWCRTGQVCDETTLDHCGGLDVVRASGHVLVRTGTSADRESAGRSCGPAAVRVLIMGSP